MNEQLQAQAADDLEDFDFEDTETADYTVKNPITGEPTKLVLVLAGPEHPERKKRKFEQQRRMRAMAQATNELPIQDPAEEEEEGREDVLANILGWKGRSEPFSRDACEAYVGGPRRRWLLHQVASALRRRELFIKRSVIS